jgi:hypothetical protein
MPGSRVICKNTEIADLGLFGPSGTSKQNAQDIKQLQARLSKLEKELVELQSEEGQERVIEAETDRKLQEISGEISQLTTRCDGYHEVLDKTIGKIDDIDRKNTLAHQKLQADMKRIDDEHFKMETRLQRTEGNILEISNNLNALVANVNGSLQNVFNDIQAMGQDLGMVISSLMHHGILGHPGQQPGVFPEPQHMMPPEYSPGFMPGPHEMYVKEFKNSKDTSDFHKSNYKIDLKPLKLRK